MWLCRFVGIGIRGWGSVGTAFAVRVDSCRLVWLFARLVGCEVYA